MNNTDFLSGGICLVIPTRKNPRVYLNIENSEIAREAFKLYNPFSKKARILKGFVKFLCIYFNSIAKIILPTMNSEKSNFIYALEQKFKKRIQSSIYFSTAHDKIVIQLQEKGLAFGYLKYAISSIGCVRVLNEKRAVHLISKLNLIPSLIHEGNFENMPFIMLPNIEGSIGRVQPVEYQTVLDSFKKQKKFKLINHPRIKNIKEELNRLELDDLSEMLNSAINESNEFYYEVFEHGDFAPWNLIKVEKKLIPFDFEYFEELGLQYLDEIKFHFQINQLLKGKKGKGLITSIEAEVPLQEFNIVFSIFLIKEILNKINAKESYQLEVSLLNLLYF